jgi:hypothetical protein
VIQLLCVCMSYLQLRSHVFARADHAAAGSEASKLQQQLPSLHSMLAALAGTPNLLDACTNVRQTSTTKATTPCVTHPPSPWPPLPVPRTCHPPQARKEFSKKLKSEGVEGERSLQVLGKVEARTPLPGATRLRPAAKGVYGGVVVPTQVRLLPAPCHVSEITALLYPSAALVLPGAS